MPPVPQHVLNWLYSVLTSEYRDVNRAYGDVAQALAQYPSLAPRTDVHTFENGTSALLVHLTGTLPVVFRGNTYRFPISVRLPYSYPREPPLVYVTPTESMMVRPGQHVDPQGQVYHPYLAGWPTFWDKSTILDFLAILRDVFAKEPPVIARPQQQASSPAPSTPQHVQTPPPLPPPPRELAAQSPTPLQPGPPPPPPKPTAHPPAHTPSPSYHDPSGAPPRPPPPPGHHSGPPVPARPHTQAPPSRYDSAPPLPHQQHQQQQPPQPYQQHQQSPPPPFHPGPPGPSSHVNNFLQRQHPQAAHPSPPAPSSYDPRRASGPPPGWQPPPQQHQQPPYQQQHHPQHQPQPPAPRPKTPPPPNLLDEPLTLDLPTTNLPAPPIPPNPEKDMLLRQLAQTLYAHRQRSREQNESSLAGLRAQRNAMANASAALQSEMAGLAQTSALLASNAGILHDALRKADAVIEGSRRQTAPDVDELLVAPTVVANQLYALVAEERAMGDAIFVLGRAVERGRISAPVFAKTTRALAREWYLKKALARKIARGMGLTA
ncbi:ESCRT-I component [Plectosphaerella cucumerina]|uniref:ESCRT-I component n=1 Tax=Plectosphaerella cucumerina TaxID=40658 RepID=A0A8K0TN70_9PEZI|nr:ESCRT-I component [Plectosphaerella cucumerina]